ncbi:polysialyltransferase family glycosyltransferase [Vibrio splendidus]|uniref:polysialyltransferase family glycosyltransferase n=1 Tax=Vibrio splendidus TaxID=29497 RepID=UPI0007F97CBE|nr:polysialyltransferase family glycosyltransferase [Vibrio splendidus]OBT24229.1 hypothetical protein A9262_19665 [Vibrio splendidus]
MHKRLVVDNTYHSLLLYILSYKNWKDAEFIIIRGRVSEKFIERLSQYVNVEVMDNWPVIWLKNPIKSFLNRRNLLKKLDSVTEVVGNIYELKLELAKYPKMSPVHVDDGRMTLEQLNGSFHQKIKYKFLRDNFFIRHLCKINYHNCNFFNNLLLPSSYKGKFPRDAPITGSVNYVDLKRELFILDEKSKKEIEDIFSFDSSHLTNKIENLLLLQPLSKEGFVKNDNEEIEIYRKIIAEQFGEQSKKVFIKPHPRKSINYSDYFPNCTILSGDFPYELFLAYEIELGKVVTISSSGVSELSEISEEIIVYGHNEILG